MHSVLHHLESACADVGVHAAPRANPTRLWRALATDVEKFFTDRALWTRQTRLVDAPAGEEGLLLLETEPLPQRYHASFRALLARHGFTWSDAPGHTGDGFLLHPYGAAHRNPAAASGIAADVAAALHVSRLWTADTRFGRLAGRLELHAPRLFRVTPWMEELARRHGMAVTQAGAHTFVFEKKRAAKRAKRAKKVAKRKGGSGAKRKGAPRSGVRRVAGARSGAARRNPAAKYDTLVHAISAHLHEHGLWKPDMRFIDGIVHGAGRPLALIRADHISLRNVERLRREVLSDYGFSYVRHQDGRLLFVDK